MCVTCITALVTTRKRAHRKYSNTRQYVSKVPTTEKAGMSVSDV